MTVTEWVRAYSKEYNMSSLLEIVKIHEGKHFYYFENWSERKPKIVGSICDILVKCSYCSCNLDDLLYKYKNKYLRDNFIDSLKQGLTLDTVIKAGLLVSYNNRSILQSRDFSNILSMLEGSFVVLNNQIGTINYSECEVKYFSGSEAKDSVYMGTPDMIVNNTLYEFKVSTYNGVKLDWILQALIYYCLVLMKKYYTCIMNADPHMQGYLKWSSTHDIKKLVVFNFLNESYYTIDIEDIPRTLLRDLFVRALNSDLPTLQRLSLEHMETSAVTSLMEVERLKMENEFLRSEIRYAKA